MGIISFLASIPTAANLLLKLRDAEAQIATIKAELEQEKRQSQALRARIKHLEAPSQPSQTPATTQDSWNARKW